MPSSCVSLLSLIASANAGVSADGAGGASAICVSSSCFFKGYPSVASLLLSSVAFASSSCFFK